MSDVERWLQNHASEGSDEDDIVSKEEMWKSFPCKSDIKVGRELFFLTLGWLYLVWSTRMWFQLTKRAGEWDTRG